MAEANSGLAVAPRERALARADAQSLRCGGHSVLMATARKIIKRICTEG